MSESNTQRDLAHERLETALGVEPFPWQVALLDRVLDGNLPSAIDVPTGLGKTAVMAVWLVGRAAGAKLPRRLVYVVDRRAVVDQATAVAENLQKLVDGDAKLKGALGLDGSLPISTLRGEHLDNRQWLTDPGVPAIVLGTVDMIGSRLLFGGYGVSNRMRPYHAGLLGADSLIVLDEAHLTPPFERLIEALASGRDARGRSLRADDGRDGIVPPLRFLSLSATGRHRDDTLSLSDADRDDSVVARRLGAIKRTSVRDEVNARDLPEKLAEEAWALSERGAKPVRCIVFCNSRDDATKVLDGLAARRKKAGVEHIDADDLFVGGRRLYEREEAARWLAARGFLAGSSMRPERATFVIATSAGEVGVDLDADHMVSDLVAWERMVQRLGRVNRRGEGDATVVIVPAISDDAQVKDRLAAVRALLHELPKREDGTIDASPGGIVAFKARCPHEPALADLVEQASTPPELHPPLERPTIEAWSMTSLEEHTGRPEVAPWIRGWIEDEDPRTNIVWRKYLPVTDADELLTNAQLEAFREAADPHMAERLETETWRVVDWLDHRLKALKIVGEEGIASDPNERPLRRTDVVAVILDGPFKPRALKADDLSNKEKREALRRALAGGVLLVDERLGGLKRGLLNEDSHEAPDVTLIDGDPRIVPFRVRRTMDAREESPRGWRTETRVAVGMSDDGEETAWLVIESLANQAAESEEGRSVGARHAQKLDEHESWAEQAARQIAERHGLPDAYARMLEVAARLHDEGKRARRWQQAFHADSDGVYAKTTSRPNLKILDYYRHELGSLPYAERHERVQALEAPLRELCLHLIAAHHGNARPLLRTDGAEEPPTRLVQRAEEIALRFVRLERQWGPWGLAWWEALLRAADQQASRRNDMEERNHG
jgi:CRISPR-associated endonuclease/helicase Cas3